MEDLWSCLQACHKPVVLWGMGDGADKIINVCQEKGIEIRDFFASDGFVRGQLFHGKQVLSYQAVREKYGDGGFVILLAFGSALPDVLANVQKIAAENTLYVPDVPVCLGGGIFDAAFYQQHKGELDEVRRMLADEESVRLFDTIVRAKLTGNPAEYFSCMTDPVLPYLEILHPQQYRTTIDFGAYTGDTVKELSRYADSLETIFAVEPDSRTYKKLETLAQQITNFTLRPVHAAAWSSVTTLPFGAAGGRGASFSAAKRQEDVATVTADVLAKSEAVDFIKYDVEGAEKEALQGSAEVIRRDRPELLVSLYHRSEDLYELPLLVHTLCPDYKLYVRRPGGLPAWDINLYAAR